MNEHEHRIIGRRAMLAGAAVTAAAVVTRAQTQTPATPSEIRLGDIAFAPANTITVERRDDIVLVGLNRPFIQNRLDPQTRGQLGHIFFQYQHDPSLRAVVLFGHGENFSRGIDVDASQATLIAGRQAPARPDVLDPLGNSQPHRTKPLVVVVHGDTWNLGHELYLAGDIRVAAGTRDSDRTRTRTVDSRAAEPRSGSFARQVRATR